MHTIQGAQHRCKCAQHRPNAHRLCRQRSQTLPFIRSSKAAACSRAPAHALKVLLQGSKAGPLTAALWPAVACCAIRGTLRHDAMRCVVMRHAAVKGLRSRRS